MRHSYILILFLVQIMIYGCQDNISDVNEEISNVQSLLEDGKPREAVIRLNKILLVDKYNSTARFLMAKSYFILSDIQRAEIETQKAIDLDFNNKDELRLLQAEIALMKGEYKNAISLLEGTAFSKDYLQRMRFVLIEANLSVGEIKRARSLFNVIPVDDIYFDEYCVAETKILFSEGRIEESLRVIEDCLEKDRNNYRFWHLHAVLQKSSKNIKQARQSYEHAINYSPKSYVAKEKIYSALELAEIELNGKSVSEAKKILARVKNHVKHPLVPYVDAVILFEEKNFISAEERLYESLELNEKYLPSLYLMYQIKLRTNNNEQANLYAGKIEQVVNEIKTAALIYDDEAREIHNSIKNEDSGRSVVEALEMLTNSSKKNVKARILLIDALLRENELIKANKYTNEFLEEHPGDPAANLLRGVVLYKLGEHNAATKHFKTAQGSAEYNNLALVYLSNISIANKNYKDALELLGKLEQDAAKKYINVEKVIYRKALVYALNKEIHKSIELLEKYLDEQPVSKNAMIELAKYYMLANDSKKGLEQINIALKSDYNDINLLLLKAKLLHSIKQPEEAKKIYSELMGKVNDPRPYYHIAMIYDEENKPELMRKNLIKAIESNKQFYPAFFALVMAEKEDGHIEMARKHIINFKRANEDMHAQLAEAYMIVDDVEMARAEFKKAIQAQPKNKTLLLQYANFLRKIKDVETARNELASWLKSTFDIEMMYLVAVYSQEIGDDDFALKYYSEILNVNSNNAKVLNNMATILQNNNKHKALSYAKSAYQLDPNNPYVQDTYGWLLVSTGEVDLGVELLQTAYEITKHPDIGYHLAYSFFIKGNSSSAKVILKNIVNLPEFDEKTNAINLYKKFN